MGQGAYPSVISAEFVDSEEFPILFLSIATLIVLTIPLMLVCIEHLNDGELVIGCSFGLLGITTAGISGWKLVASIQRTRESIIA